MTHIARPMASPSLQRELPSAVIPFWPALVPQFDRVGNTQLLNLVHCDDAQVLRPIEAQQARQVLLLLAQHCGGAAVDHVYMKLAEVAAYLKLGDAVRAKGLLRALASSPQLAASLATPARYTSDLTLGAHPLWLVMHVAIEAGSDAGVLAEILACGLHKRLAMEPELAAGLLLNALKWGDSQALQSLQAAGVTLTARARALLHKNVQALSTKLHGRSDRRVALQEREDRYLKARCRALTLLGEDEAARQLQASQMPEGHSLQCRIGAAWSKFAMLATRLGPAPSPPSARNQRTSANGEASARRANI